MVKNMQIVRKMRFVHQRYAKEAGKMRGLTLKYWSEFKGEKKDDVEELLNTLKLILYKIRFSSRIEKVNKKIGRKLRNTLKGKLNEQTSYIYKPTFL